MKVLYVVSTLKPTGPVNLVKTLIKHLDGKHYEISLIALSPFPRSPLEREFRDLGVRLVQLDVPRRNVVKLAVRFKKAVADFGPNVVHSHCLRPDLLTGFLLSKKYPCCCTLHNCPTEDYTLEYGKIKGYMGAWAHLAAVRRIRYPIACSRSVQKVFQERFRIPALVVQNGIDVAPFAPASPADKNALRDKLGLPRDKNLIATTSNLSTRKDPITILKAFAQSNLRDGFCLLFLGEGDIRDQAERFASDLSLPCIFTGHVPRVSDYLQSSDFFLSASISEGLPSAVQEAAAVGLPLILSDIPQHKEILEYDPRAGYLFRVGEPASLTSALNGVRDLSRERRAEMAEAARNLVLRHFTAEIMAAKYVEIYERMQAA